MTAPGGRRPPRLFLVECYLHAATPREVAAAMTAVRAAADLCAPPVTMRCCLAVPGDDSYFGVFTAADVSALEGVFDRAGVIFERIVEAATVPLDRVTELESAGLA
ncbi:hypothetical protein FHX81_1084 [Saccharothrix saharensis]|uniref:DUF4242 domain-containing protein n=1 Tax=Saccharothrix saharensis TaxID=571190 RepID=A0A543J7J3_9PSEU|nr:hypothetical protein [Saccharothrix saharensis]TQM78803.1 hypothetical protein FHX81_1084 [Saccharothrix saharensis]